MSGLALTIVQIVLIVGSCRLAGLIIRHLGQPPVVGDIAAGIILGPSVFGRVAPAAFGLAFPPGSVPALLTLSEIGLILFMFLVGLELAPAMLRERRTSILMISNAGMILPFILGLVLAGYLSWQMSDGRGLSLGFALFIGTSMSVTAFPVLARILADRGLLHTRMGNTAIACAAVTDAVAWCMLALVVVIARGGSAKELVAKMIALSLYVVIMIGIVRPLLGRVAPIAARKSSETVLAGTLLIVLASSWITALLGVHAVFGAFLAGAILPREKALIASLIGHLRGLTCVILLPLFFAVTGLRTDIGLLTSTKLWLCCAAILAVAVVGKVGGATLGAVASGVPWSEAAAIGVLMNTRGLMEIVVLNIGIEIGVISPVVFSMIVMTALVTTAMTTPLLDRILRTRLEAPAVMKAVA